MPGAMEDSQANVIRQLLIDLGLGVAPSSPHATDWAVIAHREVDRPDNVIIVKNSEGQIGQREHVEGERDERNGIQVIVRSGNTVAGYNKARAIAVAMDQQMNQQTVTVGDNQYLVWTVIRTSDVMYLGEEEPQSTRSLHSINAVVSLRQEEGTGT